MTSSDWAVVGGLGLLGWYLIQQQQPAPGGSISIGGGNVTWQWPQSRQLFGISDGVDVPAYGVPSINSSGRVVPGGGASAVYSRPIAPSLWAMGGSPSGWNAAGSVGYGTDVAGYPLGY